MHTMAITYPYKDVIDPNRVDVPAPQQQNGSSIIVHLNGDGAGYDPETDTVQTVSEDGDTVTVSFGEPAVKEQENYFHDNLAEYMSDAALTEVSSKLLAGIEADEMSRQAWLENAAKGIGLLGLELKAQQ